jgi:hypothetical protein
MKLSLYYIIFFLTFEHVQIHFVCSTSTTYLYRLLNLYPMNIGKVSLVWLRFDAQSNQNSLDNNNGFCFSPLRSSIGWTSITSLWPSKAKVVFRQPMCLLLLQLCAYVSHVFLTLLFACLPRRG